MTAAIKTCGNYWEGNLVRTTRSSGIIKLMANSQKIVKGLLADFVEILIIGIAVFALAWVFLAEPLEVSGESMEPNLVDREQIIVEKISMTFGEITRGDVVVFNSPEEDKELVIKRVIGIPGDTVMIQNGGIILNGTPLEEPYVKNDTITEGKSKLREGVSAKIPPNAYFLLGDNRENSTDSRELGPISNDAVIGKAVLVYYPFDSFRKVNN